jgi:hypothetical protein
MKGWMIGFIILLIGGSCTYSQDKKENPFQMVSVPDSIVNKLEEAYNKNAKNVNAGKNVFNLLNRKDFIFGNGIYSFRGQGPHFPRRIFIFNKGLLFIFDSEGAYNPKGVLEEFVQNIDILGLTNEQIVKYSKVISDYLEEEEGNTYGAEIK